MLAAARDTTRRRLAKREGEAAYEDETVKLGLRQADSLSQEGCMVLRILNTHAGPCSSTMKTEAARSCEIVDTREQTDGQTDRRTFYDNEFLLLPLQNRFMESEIGF